MEKSLELAISVASRDRSLHEDDLMWAYNRLGQLFSQEGRVAESEDLLRVTEGSFPRDFNAPYQLGLIDYSCGDFPSMEAHCRKAVDLKPDWVDAHFNIAVACINQKKFVDAYREFATILRGLNPHSAEVWALLAQTRPEAVDQLRFQGEAALGSGQFGEAIRDFRNLLAFDSEDKKARERLRELSVTADTQEYPVLPK